jgi:hypothetical protein
MLADNRHVIYQAFWRFSGFVMAGFTSVFFNLMQVLKNFREVSGILAFL